MAGLQRGDLCEIVDHPDWKGGGNRNRIGNIVILAERATDRPKDDPWNPRWHIVGDSYAEISEKVLRKLPPPAFDDELIDEQQLETQNV